MSNCQRPQAGTSSPGTAGRHLQWEEVGAILLRTAAVLPDLAQSALGAALAVGSVAASSISLSVVHRSAARPVLTSTGALTPGFSLAVAGSTRMAEGVRQRQRSCSQWKSPANPGLGPICAHNRLFVREAEGRASKRAVSQARSLWTVDRAHTPAGLSGRAQHARAIATTSHSFPPLSPFQALPSTRSSPSATVGWRMRTPDSRLIYAVAFSALYGMPTRRIHGWPPPPPPASPVCPTVAALVELVGFFRAVLDRHTPLSPFIWHPQRAGWPSCIAAVVVASCWSVPAHAASAASLHQPKPGFGCVSTAMADGRDTPPAARPFSCCPGDPGTGLF